MSKIKTLQMAIIVLMVTMLSACATENVQPVAAAKSNNLVLVAGATGKTGKEVVAQLLEDNVSVRVLARNEKKARTMFGNTVDFYIADIKDPAAVAGAMKGVSSVISAIGSAAPKGPNSPEFVDYMGVKNLVDGSVAANVERFVLVSSMGATHKNHRLNKLFGNVMVWKLKGENSLRESGLAYTIVRPGGLTDGELAEGTLRTGQGDDMEPGRISRKDVAAVVVAALSQPESRNKTFEVVTDSGSNDRDWQSLFAALQAD